MTPAQLDDLLRTAIFIPVLIGWALLPVSGYAALGLIVPFGSAVSFYAWLMDGQVEYDFWEYEASCYGALGDTNE